MFFIVVIISWIIIFFTMNETRGTVKILLALFLGLSITSFFLTNILTFLGFVPLMTLIVAVICLPYLAYNGYSIWR